MARRALVTGGSGFLGQYLVKELKAAGWHVRILDILSPEISCGDFVEGDIRDLGVCMNACLDIDVVFHNVAQVPLAKDKELFHTVNIQGTQNILEAAFHNRVNHFVYTSSSAVFGLPNAMPANLNTALYPIEEYGQTKLKGEKLVESYIGKIPNTSVVRPRTILGAGRLGLFSILFDWISDGLDVFVFDGGKKVYQFIHAEDLTKGIVAAGSVPGHNVFNLGALEFSSLRGDLEDLLSRAGTKSKIRSFPGWLIRKPALIGSKFGLIPFASYQLLLYSQAMYFDSTKDWELLGIKPRFSNSQALLESYRWFIENKAMLELQQGKSMHSSITKGKSINFIKFILKYI